MRRIGLYLVVSIFLSLAFTIGSFLPLKGNSRLIAAEVAAAAGHFSPIRFAPAVLDDNSPVDVMDTFPQGSTIVYATLEEQGLNPGDSYRTEWLYNGQVQPNLVNKFQWDASYSPKIWEWLSYKDGIPVGEWQLNLYFGDTLEQSAKFTITPNPQGQPGFGPVVFAPGIDSNNNAINPPPANDPKMPAGAKNMYVFFNGLNVPQGTQWSYQWFRNGSGLNPSQVWTWNFGANDGIHFSLLDKDGVVDPGAYELKLFIGSRLAGIGTVYVPQAQAAVPQPTAAPAANTPAPQPTLAPAASTPVPQPTPVPPTSTPIPQSAAAPVGGGHFGPILFAPAVLDDDSPVDVTTTFPQGVTILYAAYVLQGMSVGDSFRTEWLYNGQVQTNLGGTYKWDTSSSPKQWDNLFSKDGIDVGEWQLNLYFGDMLEQSAKFTITPNPQGQPGFGPIVFAPGIDSNNNAVNPLPADDPKMPAGAKNMYVFFNGLNVPQGTQWSYQWLRDGNAPQASQVWSWNFQPNEQVHFSLLDQDGVVAPGAYELKLFIGSRLAGIGTVYVPQSQ